VYRAGETFAALGRPGRHEPLSKENLMNVWKPIAICSVVGLVTSVFVQYAPIARARGNECHNQNNMQDALDGLKVARAFLDKAEHNKGGWRVNAIQSTYAALKETNRGCAFANGDGKADPHP
jgi:hypothetical protein